MGKKNWKNSFLSSSFPLEYEVSLILKKHDVIITPDYLYPKFENDQKKEYSVDMYGVWFYSESSHKNIRGETYFLVECKYRNPKTKCMFLADINKPYYSYGEKRWTIKKFDEFTYYHLPEDPLYEFGKNKPICYKGTEIDLSKGEVDDREMKHGIDQLKYALPYLITSNIKDNLKSYAGEAYPFFIVPILVTTAELRIMNKNTSIKKVKESKEIKNFSKRIPYLILYDSIGPDFIEHCQREFEYLRGIRYNKNLVNIENELKELAEDEYFPFMPSVIGKGLADGNTALLEKYCNHFIICNLNELPKLVLELKKIISTTIEKGISMI